MSVAEDNDLFNMRKAEYCLVNIDLCGKQEIKVMIKRHKNKGSSIIEMTLIIPILLGIVYLYLSLFLFLIHVSQNRNDMIETLYAIENVEQKENATTGLSIRKKKNGNKISVYANAEFSPFEIELEFHRNEDSAVDNIRRWQLVANTIRTGKKK